MGFIRTLLFVVILIIGGFIVYIYSGSYNIAATKPDPAFMHWIFETAKEHSIKKHAEYIDRPVLNSDEIVQSGFEHYNNMCSGCHGAPGKEPAKGFYPAPPELADDAEEFSSSELFWIIKNGIKMTGMPSFEGHLDDEEIWSVVAGRVPEGPGP